MLLDNKKRKCFTSKLNELERGLLVNLIKIVDSILTLNNIDWTPIGGNSLSVLRYNKLILPWDDDFDMVIRKNRRRKGLRILKKELPKYGCVIKYWNIWNKTNSKLFKIYFKDREGTISLEKDNKTCIFPFIDLFICNKNSHPNRNKDIIDYSNRINNIKSLSSEAVDLDILEYPLKIFNCEGIPIKIPTRGFRSIRRKKKSNLLNVCYDSPFNHKIGEKRPCDGINTFKCNLLSVNY